MMGAITILFVHSKFGQFSCFETEYGLEFIPCSLQDFSQNIGAHRAAAGPPNGISWGEFDSAQLRVSGWTYTGNVTLVNTMPNAKLLVMHVSIEFGREDAPNIRSVEDATNQLAAQLKRECGGRRGITRRTGFPHRSTFIRSNGFAHVAGRVG